jgi:hypothetical protein
MERSLLDRYRHGESKDVIALLSLAGPLIPGSKLELEAREVAVEIVDRCQRNIERLADKLDSLDFSPLNPRGVYGLATEESKTALSRCQREWGKFPVLIEEWYSRFEFVDFRQTDEQLHDPGPLRGLSGFGQLVMVSLSDVALLREEDAANFASDEAFRAKLSAEKEDAWEPGELESWFFTGQAASNNTWKGFVLPKETFDAHLYDEGVGPQSFYDDLVGIFEAGGFPRLTLFVRQPKWRDFLGMPNPEKLLEFLNCGLEEI